MRKVLLGILGLVVVAVLAGWLFRGPLLRLWGAEEVLATSVSPEAADLAERKLERLRTKGETVRLSDVELTSLLRYRMRDRIPGDLASPAVVFEGDTLRLHGRVPSDRLPDMPPQVQAFLPDTADVEILGHLRTVQPGQAAIEIRRITVAGLPVPDRLYRRALERLGRTDQPGLGPTDLPFRLPEGVGSARLEGGLLVLSPNP